MPAASPTFGPSPCANGNIVTLVRRDGLRIPLHRELAPLVSMLMDLTEARGYNIVPGWTWGHACRKISGTSTWSNHARGAAVDINAPMNPYASAAWHQRNATATIFGLRRRTDIPQWVFELWEEHGFYAGVRYTSKPDPMHFEQVESVAVVRAITKRLQGLLNHPEAALPKPAPPKPPPEEENDDMLIVTCPGQPTRFKDGPTCSTIGPATRLQLIAAKVREAQFTKDDYDDLLAQVEDALGR